MFEIAFLRSSQNSRGKVFSLTRTQADHALLENITQRLIQYVKLGFLFHTVDLSSTPAPFDLGTLIELRFLLQDQGGDLVVQGLPAQVDGFIREFGLSRLLPAFVDDEILPALTKGEMTGPVTTAVFPARIFLLTPQHPSLVLSLPSELEGEKAHILQQGLIDLCDHGKKLSILNLQAISSPTPAILEILHNLAEHWHSRGSAFWIANVSPAINAILQQSDVLSLEKVAQSPEGLDLFQLALKEDGSIKGDSVDSKIPSPYSPTNKILTALEVKLHPLPRKDGTSAVFMKLTGSLNTANYSDFSDLMEGYVKENIFHFSLDLSALKYVNSTGLSLLIQLSHEMMEKKGKLCLVGMSKNVRGIVVMMGVDAVLTMVDGEDEAKKILDLSPGSPSPVFVVPLEPEPLKWEELSMDGGRKAVVISFPQDLGKDMMSFEMTLDQLCEQDSLLQIWDGHSLGKMASKSFLSLAKWMARIKNMGGRVVIVCLSPSMEEHFNQAGIDQHVSILNSREEALEALRQ